LKDDTPYRERPPKEIAAEAECMRTIFAQAPEVPVIYEAFGGIGKTAAVLRQRFPKATIQSFDLDQKCCDLYNAQADRFMGCSCEDASVGLQNLKWPKFGIGWGASLDFNKFTLLDAAGRKEGLWKRHLIDQVAVRKPKWVQITDSAVCYLATNWRRYGLEENSLVAYTGLLGKVLDRAYGLKLKTYANHRAATYLLFET
jgi:hypothetical protein